MQLVERLAGRRARGWVVRSVPAAQSAAYFSITYFGKSEVLRHLSFAIICRISFLVASGFETEAQAIFALFIM